MDREKLAAMGRAIARKNRAERERLQRELAERIDAAWAEVQRLTEAFRAMDPELRQVILFGSLAEGRARSLSFDIDLAVDSDRYLQLVSVALESPFRVDVVDLRSASAYIREAVSRFGKVLYDKRQTSV